MARGISASRRGASVPARPATFQAMGLEEPPTEVGEYVIRTPIVSDFMPIADHLGWITPLVSVGDTVVMDQTVATLETGTVADLIDRIFMAPARTWACGGARTHARAHTQTYKHTHTHTPTHTNTHAHILIVVMIIIETHGFSRTPRPNRQS